MIYGKCYVIILLWCFFAPLCWEPFKAIMFSPMLTPGYPQVANTQLLHTPFREGWRASNHFTTLHIVSNCAVGKYNCKQLCRWQMQATQSVGNLFSKVACLLPLTTKFAKLIAQGFASISMLNVELKFNWLLYFCLASLCYCLPSPASLCYCFPPLLQFVRPL